MNAMYQKFCGVPAQRVAVCPNVAFSKDFQDAYTLLEAPFDGRAISPSGNSNWSQLNDPRVNAALDTAARTVDPVQREKAEATADRLVTSDASVIPWLWDDTPVTRSKNVVSIPNGWTSTWDFGFTYLK